MKFGLVCFGFDPLLVDWKFDWQAGVHTPDLLRGPSLTGTEKNYVINHGIELSP